MMPVGSSDSPDVSLSELRLAELLDQLGARTSTPGGGAVAALTTALAASLVAMAARFAGNGEAVNRAEELRERAVASADDDARAYRGYLAARRLGSDQHLADQVGVRAQALAAARDEISDVPLRIAEAAAQVAELAEAIAVAGNPNLRGDAITGALLAAAAAEAAASLVAENRRDTPSDRRVTRAAALAARARRSVRTVHPD